MAVTSFLIWSFSAEKFLRRGRCGRDQAAADIRLSLAFENFRRNNSGKGAPHERPALMGAHELLARYGGTEGYQFAIEKRVSSFAAVLVRGRSAGNLAGQNFHGGRVCLQARERAEEAEAGWESSQAGEVACAEAGRKPAPVVFEDGAFPVAARQKMCQHAVPQSKDWLSFGKRPTERTPEELNSAEAGQQVSQFRHGRGHASEQLVASQPRQDNRVSVLRYDAVECFRGGASLCN